MLIPVVVFVVVVIIIIIIIIIITRVRTDYSSEGRLQVKVLFSQVLPDIWNSTGFWKICPSGKSDM